MAKEIWQGGRYWESLWLIGVKMVIGCEDWMICHVLIEVETKDISQRECAEIDSIDQAADCAMAPIRCRKCLIQQVRPRRSAATPPR